VPLSNVIHILQAASSLLPTTLTNAAVTYLIEKKSQEKTTNLNDTGDRKAYPRDK